MITPQDIQLLNAKDREIKAEFQKWVEETLDGWTYDPIDKDEAEDTLEALDGAVEYFNNEMEEWFLNHEWSFDKSSVPALMYKCIDDDMELSVNSYVEKCVKYLLDKFKI